MLVEQRQELLLRELRATGAVRVADLAVRFGVSAGTIRRDLSELAALGRLTKVRGGAITAVPAAKPRHEPCPEPVFADGEGPTLGLLVPSATYYYPNVVGGVRAVAARRGARIVIGLTDYAPPRDLQQIDELCSSGADGLLIASASGHYVPEATLERLRATGKPFVLMERHPEDSFEPCEFVVSDHRQGAYRAVGHLHALGHDRVACYLTGSPTAPLVAEGHAHAVARLGLDPSAPVVDGGRPPLGSRQAVRQYDTFIDRCVASGARAALVHSDHDAIELLQRLRARGLRTPEDMALIAYDDEFAALAEVPLTAVAPPKRQLGEQAAHLLLDRLRAPGPLPARQVVLQPTLTVRASCGAAGLAAA
ncbi:substrate-binding domain-containing protein [Streptomyces radicis]|uniref:DeoR family transcriptional regulator n=1 Tax=Streptomyces radicis TaxID=1750517 RepID=A0A3A9W9M2_9ACTN|nr:substrate-binding domain-containing protein [Streptomyces radicis]RKN09580.1 DeoR family transcriptional regulator [Streptomyces radicis]RKN23258.1 DeoR family transcriptional regulator [Streptomyces radicis]